MATIKVMLRPSTVKGRPGTIIYKISHKFLVKQITTTIKIFPRNWDPCNSRIIGSESPLVDLQNKIDADVKLLRAIIEDFNSRGIPYSGNDIVERFNNPQKFVSVVDFTRRQIQLLEECNRIGTSKNYKMALNMFNSFLQSQDCYFSDITAQLIERYSDFLKKKGMVRNSLSFYMRVLRAIYNKGVRLGYVAQSYPFRNVYTGIDRTKKRAVKESLLSRLATLDLQKNRNLAFSRDLFLFSFYCRGMAFVDMAFLKKEGLMDGFIIYSRHKTGQTLQVKIEKCMVEIIRRWIDPRQDSPYLFPIIKSDSPEQAYKEYRSALRIYNARLKKISRLLDISASLSSYTSRHTWATVARNLNVPISVISAGMGHTSEKTTEIYLNSIENSLIDNANRGIINSINPHPYSLSACLSPL